MFPVHYYLFPNNVERTLVYRPACYCRNYILNRVFNQVIMILLYLLVGLLRNLIVYEWFNYTDSCADEN